MSKTTKTSTIQVEDRTEAEAPAAAKVESVTTKMGSTEIETFTGVQPGVNFAGAEPVAPAAEDAE